MKIRVEQETLRLADLQMQTRQKALNTHRTSKLSFTAAATEAELTHAACNFSKSEPLTHFHSQADANLSSQPILQLHDEESPTMRQCEDNQKVGSTCEQLEIVRLRNVQIIKHSNHADSSQCLQSHSE